MKILVTGGTVFVSRFAAEYFTKNGYEVYVLNRNSRPQSKGVRLINCDRHNLGAALKLFKFDLIFDVTAYTEKDVLDLLNGLGEFSDYVMISSSAVYPETLPQPFKEVYQTGENIHWGDYGTNKIAAEEALLKRVPNAYIIRPPYLYGAMNNLYREAFVFDCAENDLPFYVPKNGEIPLQFFDVEDLCRFVEIIAEQKPANRIFNVGNCEIVSVKEWARLCYEVLGRSVNIKSAPDGVEIRNYFPFRDYGYELDISRQLELMPVLKPLKQGLKESYEWYKYHKQFINKKDYISYIKENFK